MNPIEGNLRAAGWVAKAALLLGALAMLLVLAPRAGAAQGPYEPNDSTPAAAGPLEYGISYSAELETSRDIDFYYFYVTSPEAAQVDLTVANLGGGSGSLVIDARITDALSTPVGAISYLAQGAQQTISLSLPPQKYFVSVTTNEAFDVGAGSAYLLTAAGSSGAFGPYAEIAGRCADATLALAKARRGLRRARGKQQRTTARLRLARYGSRRARDAAQRAQRRASRRVRDKQRAGRRAKRLQQPWCSISQ